MSGKARKVVISERQQEVLLSFVRCSTSVQRLVTRGKIILLAFQGKLNQEIGRQVGLNPDQVGTWRRRWQQAFERLVAIECWFSILVRRVIKRGNFKSVEELRDKILSFINYFNRTLAKPFKWTFTGRPLNL